MIMIKLSKGSVSHLAIEVTEVHITMVVGAANANLSKHWKSDAELSIYEIIFLQA